VVSPGEGSITIASDDEEALDRLESLLRTLAAQPRDKGREFTIFPLQNASAPLVADTLKKFFSGTTFGFGAVSGVAVVADPRLNALIVRANANDLATIEQLVKVLDTSEVPLGVTKRVESIALANGRAEEVERILKDVYKTALSAAGNRRQLPTPGGVSREVAALLEQLNQQQAGPEMTLSIDVVSNSLIVMATPTLLEEVKGLVQSLDEAAAGAGRTIRVIPLERTNSEAVKKALDWLQRDSLRSRRGPSNSP
jgi:type II secretory pathway component GspD/PulD (secretin)